MPDLCNARAQPDADAACPDPPERPWQHLLQAMKPKITGHTGVHFQIDCSRVIMPDAFGQFMMLHWKHMRCSMKQSCILPQCLFLIISFYHSLSEMKQRDCEKCVVDS